jgi:hypothetical protein
VFAPTSVGPQGTVVKADQRPNAVRQAANKLSAESALRCSRPAITRSCQPAAHQIVPRLADQGISGLESTFYRVCARPTNSMPAGGQAPQKPRPPALTLCQGAL